MCQWFGTGRKITLMIAIFVSMTLKAVMQQIKRNTLFTQICNQQCAQQSTHKIYLCPNLQINKCRVPAMLMNIPVANTWSPMIQKVRINQYLFSQKALNDLCRDLYLTKENSEFLASSFQERNLLEKKVKITLHRKRTEDPLALFTMKDNVCFCNDITELFEQLEIPYDKTS